MSVRVGAVAAMACTVGLFLPVATETAGAVTAASGAGAYQPLAPTRITDTRPGSGQPNAGMKLRPAGTLNVTVPAAVPATATAVSLSVTAVDGTSNGYLTVYPTGQAPLSPTSDVNYVPGSPGCSVPSCTVSNLVVSKVNGGQVTIANGSSTGSVDVVVDLEGYFDPTTASSGVGHFFPMAPYRVADTRCGSPAPPSLCADETQLTTHTASPGPAGVLDVPLTPVSMPGLGIGAAEVQVTATTTSAPGFLTAYAGGATRPTASNVNFAPGETASNRAIVPVGPNGDINIYNSAGKTDVVVDVVGLFGDGTGVNAATTGSLYTPIVPARLADTRSDAGALGPNTSATFPVAGQGTIPADVSGSITAAALNVTEASATAPGFLSVTPSTQTPPVTTSDVNFVGGQIRANADLAELGSDGSVSLYNSAGTTQVLIDAFGYFTPASSPSQG
ncbi:MAG: hypothetical protein M3Y36_01070 [Actinomycetota bacterium]|nr:hypothetical protein [Actinomycetota bacterium]